MNKWMIAGIITGLVVGLVAIVIVTVISKIKNKEIKCKYDERQELVRGKGFKCAFFTLLVYDVIYGLVSEVGISMSIDAFTGNVIGILIGTMVYAVYTIMNDGYFALNRNPKKVVSSLLVIGLANLTIGLTQCSGHVDVEGYTPGLINIACAVAFMVIGVVLLIKNRLSAREDD